MRSSLRPFLVIAAAGLTVFALAQSPAQAQYRRVPPRPVPVAPVYYPPVARAPIVVPPVNAYTSANRNVLPGMNLNQLAMYSVLSMDPTFTPLLNSYNPYRPIYVTPAYPVLPYAMPYLPYTTAIGPSVAPYGPYNYYNPYFASFGFYP